MEDSVSGTLAAVRAGIRCLGFVGAYHDPMKRDVMARVLMGKGAGAVMGAWDEFEALLPRLQVLELPVPVDVADAVGGVEGVSLGREVLRDE